MMNKTEKQLVADLETKVKYLAALQPKFLAKDTEPDVPIPQYPDEMTHGFLPLMYAEYVSEACSTSIGHGIGKEGKTSRQRGVELYSTRKLALYALRKSFEELYAWKLHIIDCLIEEEEKAGR